MSSSPGDRPRASLARWVPLALVAAVAALYAQTYRHGFLSFDDGSYITENPHVRGGLSWDGLRWAFLEFHSANWHPLTWLSHQLDVQLFGLAPGPHHLVNAALHALAACLCFSFLWRASARLGPSFLVALSFATHPLRVESVAWAAERKDVLSAVFFFLTLCLYLRYTRAPGRRTMAAVLVAFALGLLAKPMLVTLPLVLLLLDRWPLEGWQRCGAPSPGAPPSPAPTRPGMTSVAGAGFALLREKWPLFLLALASGALTLAAQRAGGAVRSIEVLPLSARLATALLATVTYCRQTLLPTGLAFFYPHPWFVARESFSALSPAVLGAALLLVAFSLLAWRLRRRAPAVLVGWGWTLVMLLPVIGLVQVGAQAHADRYAYLPLVGFTIALVFGADALLPAGRARRVALALGLLLVGGQGLLAYRQVGTWRDVESLCRQALAVTRHNYVAHEHLGLWLQQRGEWEEAIEQYQATLASAPRLHDAHSNLGAVYMQLGRREEALACYQESLRLRPDFLDARLNWGLLLEREGDLEGALGQFETAAREHPESAAAWGKVGDALLGLGRAPRALEAYSRALERAPDSADAEAGLACALDEAGQPASAVLHFDQALRLAPGLARAVHGLAWLRATRAAPELRDPRRARELLEGCVRRGESPNWAHLRVLAATLAAEDRPGEALKTALEAAARAPRAEWERLKAERESYQAGKALYR